MILEAIYRGNYTPLDLVLPTDQEYPKSNSRINELQDQLMETLEPDQKQILQALIAEIYRSQCMESEAFFKFAFASGMQLQKEIGEQCKCLAADA